MDSGRRHHRKVFRLRFEEESQELTRRRATRRHGSDAFQEAHSAGIWLLEGVQVGSGVSEVRAAFCTTLATRLRVDLNHRPLGYELNDQQLSCC
jgi:hypothetical protein